MFCGRQTFTFPFLGIIFDLFSGDHTRFHCAQGIGCFRLGSLDGMREYTKRCFFLVLVGDVVYFLFGCEALGLFVEFCGINNQKTMVTEMVYRFFGGEGGVEGEASEVQKKSKSIRDDPSHQVIVMSFC